MITAAAISRLIRASGVQTLPSGTRPSVRGVRVTEAPSLGLVTVDVDYGLPAKSERVADHIARDLTSLGYVVEPNELDATLLSIRGRSL